MQEQNPDILADDIIPDGIWNEVYRILDSVSDECGEDELSNCDILKYEGWSGNCFSDLDKFDGDEEEYAASQTSSIVDGDWVPQMVRRKYKLIENGYEPGGLYGVTWAIFRRVLKKASRKAS